MKDNINFEQKEFTNHSGLDSIAYKKHSTGITIVYKWYFDGIFSLIIVTFLTCFCIAFLILALYLSAQIEIVMGILLIFIPLCLYNNYYHLAGLLNRSFIDVDKNRILIKHKPLPWPGRREISVNEFNILYDKKKVLHGGQGSRDYIYILYAVLNNNDHIRLFRHLSLEEGFFIEKQIKIIN